VPLASGTNQLVLLASDAKGNASSNTYTVISSTELSGAITNPVFGVFATAPSNYVSGYVSALYDAGLPTQTSITNVTINGVAAVLGTNVDAYGNVPFWTTNMIPLGVPITSTIAGPGIPTDPPGLPPMESQGYEVTGKETGLETIDGGESGIFNLYWGTSSNCWSGDLYQEVQTYDYAITNSSVQEQFVGEDNQPSPACLTVLNPDQITWLVDSDSFTTTLSTPINTSLSLGINGYMHGEGEQFADVIASYNPTNDTCTYQNETEGMRSLTRERDTGWVTFRAPWQPATNTTVVLTFQGLSYATPNNATPDLSQVLFRGQSPVSNDSESASYLMTVSSGQQYTINQDDFTWPSAESQPGNYATTFNDTWDICPILKSFAQSGNYLTDYHWLTWTAFTNHSPVHILWTNGVDITGTSGNSIIVGQQVNLTATVDTPGIATSNFTWSVSGSTVSNYIIASGSSSAQAPPLTQTNGASVAFYWVSGGQQNVSCSVLLNNGSVATSQASFAVQRPQQQITTANLQPSVDSDYSDPEQPAPAYLHLGNRAGTPGITFTRGGSDTLYGGSNYWSQVIVSTTLFFKLDNATCLQFSATNSLDQQNPYDSDQSATEDSPGVALLTNYVEVVSSNNFCMWLMYVPPGTNSIPVPSRALNWNWSGDAIFTNSSWEMRSGAGVASASSDSQTNGFPTWTGIVTGGETASPVSCPP
jgi:hypothetical protein